MASIDIDTAALDRAASDVKALCRLIDDANGLLHSSARQMDWQFDGADAYRRRLDVLGSRLETTTVLLDRHRVFLAYAAARLESGEQSVLDAAPVALGGVLVEPEPWKESYPSSGAGGGGGGGGRSDEATSRSWDEAFRTWVRDGYTDLLGDPRLGSAMEDFTGALIGEIPVIGDYLSTGLTVDQILVDFGAGDYGSACLGALEFIPGYGLAKGAAEGYFHLGEFLGDYVSVPDAVLDLYDAASGTAQSVTGYFDELTNSGIPLWSVSHEPVESFLLQ